MNKQQTFSKTNKLSGLLNLALDDLELVNKDKKYKINMNYWQKKQKGKQCEVCLAGSVLAKTFNVPKISLDDLEGEVKEETMNKLWAIDSIREGDLVQALHHLNRILRHTEEEEVIYKLCSSICDDNNFPFMSVELILGEDYRDFEVLRDCKDYIKFVTFYRGVASKLNMVGL